MCIHLRLDLEGADVSPEAIEAAVQFGVQIQREDKSIDAKTYVVAFFKKLLLQREKIDRGLLVEQIKPKIALLWQEVLSTLGERRRTLLDIQNLLQSLGETFLSKLKLDLLLRFQNT